MFTRYGVDQVGRLAVYCNECSEFSTCSGGLDAAAFVEFWAESAFERNIAWEFSYVWDLGGLHLEAGRCSHQFICQALVFSVAEDKPMVMKEP